MHETKVFLANYSLPPHIYAVGSPKDAHRYSVDVGADGLFLLPAYTRMIRRLSLHPEEAIGIMGVRQSYRGERSPLEAFSYLWKPDFALRDRPVKVATALYTVAQMPYKDDSLPVVSDIVDTSSPPVDVMIEVTDAALHMSRRMSTVYDNSHRRVVQLTSDNLRLLQEKTGDVMVTMHSYGLTGFSFHSASSPPIDEIPEEVIPYISHAEITGKRPDLPYSRNPHGDVLRISQGYDTPTTHTVRDLRRRGAPLDTLIYAVAWFEAQRDRARDVIRNLRRI